MTSEVKRLAALKSLEVMDTAPEAGLDRITELAADMFETPIALVSLVDAERQWFKSRVGLEACSTPRGISFCTHAIEGGTGSVLVVENALEDARFATNPLVTGAPHIRFYAGAVLTSSDGHNLGTLCVIDTRPRPYPSERQLSWLKKMAELVVDGIECSLKERQARKKQHLLEMAESVSGVGYWRFDMETQTPVWSDAVYRIHGVTRENFNPALDSAIDFYHPEDRAAVTENMDRALANKTGFDFRLRLIRADGALRHVVSKASCELNDKGDVVALTGVFQDITDHIEALDRAETSAARYRLLADNSRDIIAEFDTRGVMSFVSPASTHVLGHEPEAMVGRAMWEFIHPDDKKQVAENFAKLNEIVGGDGEVSVRYRARHADGHWVWLEGRPRAVRDTVSGEIVGYQDAARDVRRMVAAENNLVLARKEAEAAAQAKADFLANMSHELRTPLTAMIGFANLIKEQPELEEETRLFVKRALSAGAALHATVNDILDFSALEAGQVEIKPLPVRAKDFMHRVAEMLSYQAAEKGLELEVDCSSEMPEVLGLDSHRLRQVLLNLIGNGVKFTDHGSVRVHAGYAPQTGTLRVEVKDTGPGISHDAVMQLFQRFSQIDASSTRSKGGTGLGLAICKGLVEAMGGGIGVETAPGAGSTFWFEIPAEPMEPVALEDEGDASASHALMHCRVLVADDVEANRFLLSRVLGALGAEISTASSGEEAVRMARSAPFEIILMDRLMPGIGGLNAAQAIRDLPGPNREVPIIALSANTTGLGDVSAFDGVAGKPLDMTELLGAISTALDMEKEETYAA